ncbi:tRNA (adenosine(37)-N6)-threonylcarbamoyltransferase complex transferase subunit TsaD [Massilibacterium senegalense]|uniref:tRNA (adenosine(37)-N6)-threonylcarbamoyltransferase complex transferase subunit TsaD n=1 Tax=Massilibacterium senegalense TaxID=1632858 RepID=UPI0007804CF2|nr:tRNA (adenosine(37)-N6)-threonylcarbamoyltransferase complex transferase subunit TsaD [Massilibacterium senegalense]
MKKDELILAVETSCDETSMAVIKNGKEMVANVVSSQIESHKRFGGVVPEIASRHHVEQITYVLEETLKKANVLIDDIDAVAVTEGPGLVGALLIGVNAAKALAFSYDKPLVPVHHISGHIYANRFVKEMTFPLIALVVSGGHTELVYMKEHGHYEVIGETRDDAVGEAYDKVARVLGLAYPGGPKIDALAQEGKETIDFPRAWLEEGSFDFSFSGLKSAVINWLHNSEQRGEEIVIEDVAKSFQESVIDVLVTKTKKAQEQYGVKQILLAGGVAANKGLRARLQQIFETSDVDLVIPPLSLCTDNAAMIGAAASIEYQKGTRASLTLNANPGLMLESFNKE